VYSCFAVLWQNQHSTLRQRQPASFILGTIWQFFQVGKHTDLDRLRPRRVFRRLKFEGYVELLPLHSSESPQLEQADPSFSMSDGLSLTAKGVKEGRLTVSALLIAIGC